MVLSHEPTVARLIRMPKSLSDAIRTRAGQDNLTDTQVVRAALSTYLGIPDPTTHGNTRYHNEHERVAARRTRQKARRDLARELTRSYSK